MDSTSSRATTTNAALVVGIIVVFFGLYMSNKDTKELKSENHKFIENMKVINRLHEKTNQKIFLKLDKLNKLKLRKKKKKPKPVIEEYEERVRHYKISSGDRDLARFPSAASFEYKFGEQVRNIKSIELVKIVMSRTMYTIDNHNDKMIIYDHSKDEKFTIQIDHGFYSIGDYLQKINSILINDHDIHIQLYFNRTSSKVTVLNDGADDTYTILYNTESFEDTNFNCIGFLAEDFTLAPGESKTGSRRVDLFGANNISIELAEVSYGLGDNTLSTILVRENVVTTYENDNFKPRRVLNPLLKLDRLNIKITFKPPYKSERLYEFNGLDYSMVLEVVTMERKMPFKQIIGRYN